MIFMIFMRYVTMTGYDWLVVLILFEAFPDHRPSAIERCQVSRRLVPLGLENQTQKAHKERNTVVEPNKPVELFRALNTVQNQTYSDWHWLTSMNSFLVEIWHVHVLRVFGLCLLQRYFSWSRIGPMIWCHGPWSCQRTFEIQKSGVGISRRFYHVLSCFISISCNFACQQWDRDTHTDILIESVWSIFCSYLNLMTWGQV